MLRPQESQNRQPPHQASGTHSWGSPRQQHSGAFTSSLSECVWFLSFVFVLGICLFVCLFGLSRSEAGGCPSSLGMK